LARLINPKLGNLLTSSSQPGTGYSKSEAVFEPWMLVPVPVGALGLDLKRFKFQFRNQERCAQQQVGTKFRLGVLSAASG